MVLGTNIPQHAREPILMRGDNLSCFHWVNRCRRGKEPRSGTLMRTMGLETGSVWCFEAKDVKGVTSAMSDGFSRWDRQSIPSALYAFRPDVNWQEQDLGQTGADICTGKLAASTSTDQLRDRLSKLTLRVSGLGALFAG